MANTTVSQKGAATWPKHTYESNTVHIPFRYRGFYHSQHPSGSRGRGDIRRSRASSRYRQLRQRGGSDP